MAHGVKTNVGFRTHVPNATELLGKAIIAMKLKALPTRRHFHSVQNCGGSMWFQQSFLTLEPFPCFMSNAAGHEFDGGQGITADVRAKLM